MSNLWASIISGGVAIIVVLVGYIIWQIKTLGTKIDSSMSESHCLEHRTTCKTNYDREIKSIKKDFRGHKHTSDTGEVVLGGNQ